MRGQSRKPTRRRPTFGSTATRQGGVAFRDRDRAARTCAKTCIAESLILLTAPMRGEPVAVTSAMTAGMGDGEVSVDERLGAERRMRRRQSRKKMSTRRDCLRLRRRRTRRREPMREHGGGINAARASGTRAAHSRTRSARRWRAPRRTTPDAGEPARWRSTRGGPPRPARRGRGTAGAMARSRAPSLCEAAPRAVSAEVGKPWAYLCRDLATRRCAAPRAVVRLDERYRRPELHERLSSIVGLTAEAVTLF